MASPKTRDACRSWWFYASCCIGCFLFLGTNRRRCCFTRGAQVHGIGVLELRYDADMQYLRAGAGDQQAAIGQFSPLGSIW
jgi:hypothetical protein